jgi:hypothetical protein
MISAYSAPIIVRGDSSSEKLSRIPLSGSESTGAYSEDWLQQLLYQHPDALPISEVDDSFSGLIPVCREMETTAGPLDVLYATPGGRLVIVEAKLWRNPEARRKVIGQILDYAKELSRWSYETLDAAVRRARRAEDGEKPKGLAQVVGLEPTSDEAARFFDSVTQSLRRGDFLLLIVGDGIREGVGAITDFLDGHASLHFTFGLVEMAIFGMPDGTQLVQPRILAQSTILKRIILDIRNDSIEATEEGTEDAVAQEDGPSPELMATRKKFEAFWTGFLERLDLDDKSQPVRKAVTHQNQYFDMPKGSAGWVSAYVAPASNRAGVYLTFSKGPVGDRIFAGLQEDQEEINRELGIPVEWTSDGTKHWISASGSYSGSFLEERAEELYEFMADRVNRFVSVFRPRLEKIAEQQETD